MVRHLAGISTNDGGQAWRYFPENLMGKALVDYLSGAIKGGRQAMPPGLRRQPTSVPL